MQLTPSQTFALQHVETHTASRDDTAITKLQRMLGKASVDLTALQGLASTIQKHARVELSFHPDRKIASGTTVADQLLVDGVYRNQFETSISNGSRSAYPGGIRFEWEKRMFGGAYDKALDVERPKYGALNLLNFPDGSAPRFGSCYLCLRPSATQRSTFSYGDSVSNPRDLGTIERFNSIWAAIFNDILTHGSALGVDSTISNLLRKINGTLRSHSSSRFKQPAGRVLDHYVEAQVHGDIRLECDVECIVVDPSFKDSGIGNVLKRISELYHIELHYHNGFVVAIERIPNDFRGPAIPRLAERIATGPTINAKELGEAASSFHDFPDQWQDWGSVEDTLQHFKQLWHALVHLGDPLVDTEPH